MGEKIGEFRIFDKTIVISLSDKSSVSEGQHLIADVVGVGPDGTILDHDKLSETEKSVVFITLMQHMARQHPDGRWTMMLNGPGMAKRPTFHIHGVLPEGPGQILRFVFNPGAFLKELKEDIQILDTPRLDSNALDGLKALAKDLEENLK